MMKIGAFVDLSNLYYCVRTKHSGRKVNFRAYYNFFAELGDVKIANAYGAQMKQQARGFIKVLEAIGFTPCYKQAKEYTSGQFKRKADWDVGIAVDMIEACDDLDLIVLGSADGDMVPVVDYVIKHGCKVLVLASGISDALRNTCKVVEITDSMLEEK